MIPCCCSNNKQCTIKPNVSVFLSGESWTEASPCPLAEGTSRRRSRPVEFRAKNPPCLAHCGANAARQMGQPRCPVCVTDTCGCVVWKLVCDAGLKLGDRGATQQRCGSIFVCVSCAFLCMHVCIFNMWPLHVLISVCVWKSEPAAGPWHSWSSCHSNSPAALRK